MNVYLLKHAETLENVRGVHQGQGIGGVLSPEGVAHARAVAEHMAAQPLDRVFVSPMQRCVDTLSYLLERRPELPVVCEPAVAAKKSGTLAGKRRAAVFEEAERLAVPVYRVKPPGGESSVELQARVVSFWDRLATCGASDVLLVTHGGVIACLLLHLLGRPFEDYPLMVPDSTALTRITVSPVSGRCHIDFVNCTAHLRHGTPM